MPTRHENGETRTFNEDDECDYAVKHQMSDWLAKRLVRRETTDEYKLWMRRTGQ